MQFFLIVSQLIACNNVSENLVQNPLKYKTNWSNIQKLSSAF